MRALRPITRSLLCLTVALGAAACGGGSSHSAAGTAKATPATPSGAASPTAASPATTTPATSTAPSAATDTDSPATQLAQHALETTAGLTSLQADGTDSSAGTPITAHFDIDQQSGDCAAKQSSGGTPYMTIVIKTHEVWTRPEAAYWAGHPGGSAVQGRYLHVAHGDTRFTQLVQMCHLDSLLSPIVGSLTDLTESGTTTVNGHRGTVLALPGADGAGATVVVAADGPPYLLEAKGNKQTLDFSGFDQPVSIVQPPADQSVDAPPLTEAPSAPAGD
ncbi:hypothetical protein OG455_30135 [Kitasatospora sp. NBC_01287]|uniref:hypothetical protein n=1 Tax=Kitasatospora sp. NBC_01287 TaxID=2903573 RepID=UPI002259B3D8|nr:hypothetical protein [Kitasatospora sp. NBC_01287]MCX4749723.1 hypothetical protein [Kitasatospora sp. NBC_01287]